MKFLRIYVIRNKFLNDENVSFFKVKSSKDFNDKFFGNEIRRNLLLNLLRQF